MAMITEAAEVRLDDGQRGRDADEHQATAEPGVADPRGALLGQIRRQRHQQGDLGELGGLDVERTEVEAEPGATADRPDRDDQHQQHDRAHVEHRRPFSPQVVVDAHHDDHQDHRQDHEDLLALDEDER